MRAQEILSTRDPQTVEKYDNPAFFILVMAMFPIFLALIFREIFHIGLLWLGWEPIYIQRKKVWYKKVINLRWSWLYWKHVRHSVFVCPWNKNGEQNGNHRRRQAWAFHCFSEQHEGTRAICCGLSKINNMSPLLLGGLPLRVHFQSFLTHECESNERVRYSSWGKFHSLARSMDCKLFG